MIKARKRVKKTVVKQSESVRYDSLLDGLILVMEVARAKNGNSTAPVFAGEVDLVENAIRYAQFMECRSKKNRGSVVKFLQACKVALFRMAPASFWKDKTDEQMLVHMQCLKVIDRAIVLTSVK